MSSMTDADEWCPCPSCGYDILVLRFYTWDTEIAPGFNPCPSCGVRLETGLGGGTDEGFYNLLEIG